MKRIGNVPLFALLLFFSGMILNAQDIEPFPLDVTLYSQGNNTVLRPLDFSIKELIQPQALNGEEKIIYENIIIPFFEGLKEGEVKEVLLMPQTSVYMDGKELASLVEYRVGRSYSRGEFLLYPVRILGYSTSYTGTLYLFYYKDKWLIEDLELEETRSPAQKKGEELFEPSSLLVPF